MSQWFQKPVPRTLFHGALWSRLASIGRNGLEAGTEERANHPEFAKDVVGYVSLTDSEVTAQRFAVYAASKQPIYPDNLLVIVVDSLRAGIHGTKIIPMRGKLSNEYGGHEYLAIGNIGRDALAGAIKISDNGRRKEFIKLPR